MITGVIATVFGILGIIGLFTGNIAFVFAGGVAELAQTLMGFFINSQRNFITIVIAAVAGAAVAYLIGISILYGVMAGLCFEGAIMGIWSIYYMIHSLAHRNDHKKVYRNVQKNARRKK